MLPVKGPLSAPMLGSKLLPPRWFGRQTRGPAGRLQRQQADDLAETMIYVARGPTGLGARTTNTSGASRQPARVWRPIASGAHMAHFGWLSDNNKCAHDEHDYAPHTKRASNFTAPGRLSRALARTRSLVLEHPLALHDDEWMNFELRGQRQSVIYL